MVALLQMGLQRSRNLPQNHQDCDDREAQSCPHLLQNWVFWRRRGSRAKSCSRTEPRQQPCKYSCGRGPGSQSISPKILLIGRPKVALVFFRIKIRGNMTWYLVKNIQFTVKNIQFTSYLSVWQHVKVAVYNVIYIDMLSYFILYSMTLHIICYIIYYIIEKKVI